MKKYINFSLIIPTYNRCNLLAKTLNYLKRLDYPSDSFEMLVVDNNSNDETRQVISNFVKSNQNINFTSLFESKQGRTFAVSKGIDCAKYSKIIFIDDDVLVKKNLLRLYDSLYKKYPNSAIIGGKIIAKLPNDKQAVSVFENDYWILGQLNHGTKEKNLVYPEILFAGNMSVNLRKIDEQVFDSRLGVKYNNCYLYGEDYELCLRLHLQRHKQVVYSPKISAVNIVDKERTGIKYALRRFIGAGIERYIIDKKLHKLFPAHIVYRLETFQVFTIKKLLKSLTNKKSFLYTLSQLYFSYGYFVLGKRYI